MKKKKKRVSSEAKRELEIAAAARQALRIFEALPAAAHGGPTYFSILTECGVPSTEAKAIAGKWMLEKAQGK